MKRDHVRDGYRVLFVGSSSPGHGERVLSTPMHRSQLCKEEGADPVAEASGAGSSFP
jgi:hypothetical protein